MSAGKEPAPQFVLSLRVNFLENLYSQLIDCNYLLSSGITGIYSYLQKITSIEIAK